MRFYGTILILLFFLQPSMGIAQESNQVLYRLAKQAEADGALDISIGYYESLYQKTGSDAYYNALLELYPKADQFKEGEKMVRKRIKIYPDRKEFLVDLGYLNELAGDEKEANKNYEEALEQINENSMQTRLLANRFKQYEKLKWVEKCYLTARKLNKDSRLFQFELASIYAEQGRTSEMVDEYLNILGGNSGYIQTVQNLFSRYLHPDPEGKQMEMLKEKLIGRIQSQPNEGIYSELLIWLYVQEKNFNGAFIQAKALDRRNDEKGKRLYNLAQLSRMNQAYDVAEKCYAYILSLGEESPFELQAKMKLVEVSKARLMQSEYSKEDLLELRNLYLKTLDDLGRTAFTYSTMVGLAELDAYYLDQVDSAIALNKYLISLPGLSATDIAKSKIALADLYLLEDEIWEASLLYSQVEKAYKYDELGEIAKLKNAKIAYYTGDFYWSQAQLNVLKGSTSKLIANDAMDLSLLITDNIGLDSIQEPLQMFARAELLHLKKDYASANERLDSILSFFPMSPLKDDILFFRYKMAFEQRNYEQAASHLRSLIADYGEDILGDDALFNLAKLEEEKLGNPATAMDLYKRLLSTYPASLFVVESRKRFRKLRGDSIDNQEIN